MSSVPFVDPNEYIRPASLPVNDDALTDILQAWLVGLSGLPGCMVRPWWQVEPPQQPDIEENWIAIGIGDSDRDFDTYSAHVAGNNVPDPRVPGYNVTYRNQTLTIHVRSYGKDAQGNADAIWNNAQISQNRALLLQQGFALVRVEKPTVGTDIVKERWVPVWDFDMRLRRAVSLQYPIDDFASAGVTVTLDTDPPLVETIAVPQDVQS
jgi:hypothetical protein